MPLKVTAHPEVRESVLIVLIVLVCSVRAAHAQADPADAKSIAAVYTATPPTLDGRLDDPVWKNAAIVDDLHMVVPDAYAAPSEHSLIRVLYGKDALYFAARFDDSEPGKVTAMVLRQGDVSYGEDGFSIILDPFNQKRNGYVFDINPNGVRSQGLYTNVTEQNWNWQGIWQGATRRDGEGWAAEVAIPFKSLSFDPANETWGLNFTRWLGRRNERFGWVSHNQEQNPARSGEFTGLRGIEQGAGIDVVPGFRVGETRDYAGDRTDSFAEPSIDVFYKLTPALTAALTVNTDFSGTTVDTREINLTRFDLFFPEQRKFFLQDADIFEFGRIEDEGAKPFFSRRIGLSDAGEPIAIDVGAKLTGRIGRFDIGVLNIAQESAMGPGSNNLFAGRVAGNVLRESSLGIIVTNGDPASERDNTLLGIDFRYLNTRIGPNRTIVGSAWYQRSDTDGLHGDAEAFGIDLELPGRDGWDAELGWKEIQENYYPALGFVNRTDVREYELELGYTWRPVQRRLRAIRSGVEVWHVETLSGQLESEEITLTVVELENHAADYLTFDYSRSREHLVDPFEISDGVVIPAGDYLFDSFCVNLTTGEHRALAGETFVCDGDFYDGEMRAAGTVMTWRPSPHLRLGAGFEWNDIDLPHGAFITRLASLRADIAFTATWYWENFLQYDNVSESIGVNSILRWIPEAGRETVVVLNRQLEDPDRNNRFNSLYGELTLKLGYTFRF
ncbi:MAG: DUF5916 domain-containing protein [Woeseia sp.]